MWQEKIDAEIEATHKWLELEKEACSTTAKLPKTTNNTTQGNAHQLGEIREHVCYTSPKQIDQYRTEIRLSVGNGKSKSTSKDTYVANLKPGEVGYILPEQTCCERTLRIVNLPVEDSGNFTRA